MADYNSYKKVKADQIPDAVFDTASLAPAAGNNYQVQWIYNERAGRCKECANAGGCVCQACGRCCNWTVPANTSKVTFEIWSGGGGATGNTCCTCCSHAIGGAGGGYAVKTIETRPGCSYRVCAGGSWRCNNGHNCSAGQGCKSYVTGYNLNNFCVVGGCGGWMCNGEGFSPRVSSSSCANCNICGVYGADFGIMGTVGGKVGQGYHHCLYTSSFGGQAPFVGKWHANGTSDTACTCGCYVNWPSGGGTPGLSACYAWDAGQCCGGGVGQGGSGIVKITYS